MNSPKTATISAENTFTDAVSIGGTGIVRVEGTGTITLSLQSSYDNDSWLTEDNITGTGTCDFSGHGLLWRVGCATGDYTSGTLDVLIAEA